MIIEGNEASDLRCFTCTSLFSANGKEQDLIHNGKSASGKSHAVVSQVLFKLCANEAQQQGLQAHFFLQTSQLHSLHSHLHSFFYSHRDHIPKTFMKLSKIHSRTECRCYCLVKRFGSKQFQPCATSALSSRLHRCFSPEIQTDLCAKLIL